MQTFNHAKGVHYGKLYDHSGSLSAWVDSFRFVDREDFLSNGRQAAWQRKYGCYEHFPGSRKKAGIVVTLLDILKGTAAVLLPLLPYFHDTAVHPLLLGVAAVLGHIFPLFANLKGGKAVATSGGVLLGYNWPIFLLVIITFLIALKLTKMVSLTSIIVSILGPIYCLIYYLMTGDLYLFLVVALMGFFIFYRHRDNISRIKAGTEPKIKWL